MTDLRVIPSVTELLKVDAVHALVVDHGQSLVRDWIREQLEELRCEPPANATRAELTSQICQRLTERAASESLVSLGRVINATGVILHTGLGRAPLCPEAVESIAELSTAGNVEIDLVTGERRYRGHQLLPMWQRLTGCEDALVVNNNAAATLLTLQAMCAGKEVIISRGQLIEIGGSFRLPDIFELSGATLREVGTTNRTKVQ